MAQDEKNKFIELLRGLSIIIVIYSHYSNRIPHQSLGAAAPASILSPDGKFGVYIFFVISGYLIALSLQSCSSLGEFYSKRLSRIWPLFILASVVIFTFLSVFDPPMVATGPKQFYEQGRPSFTSFVGQTFFLRDLGFDWVDGVFWSILVELKFYLWVGLFAAIFKARYIDMFAKSTLVLGIVEFTLVLFFAGSTPNVISALMHGGFIAQHMPLFAIGMLFFTGRRDGLTISLALLCVAQACVALSDDPPFSIVRWGQWLLIMAALLAIDQLFLKNRILLFFGVYSYSIYLFHQLIGLTVMSWVAPQLGINLAMLVALAIVVPLSVLSSWAVEWRFRRQVGKMLSAVFELLRLDKVAMPCVTSDVGQAAAAGASSQRIRAPVRNVV